MKKITITVELKEETLFKSYMLFWSNTEKITYSVGDIIEIARIDCKILQSLGNDMYELEVLTSVVTKLPTCLLDEAEVAYEEANKLANKLAGDMSCEDSKAKWDFYFDKEKFYQKILSNYNDKYKTKSCTCCIEHIELKGEFIEKNGHRFCSSDCLNIYDNSLSGGDDFY